MGVEEVTHSGQVNGLRQGIGRRNEINFFRILPARPEDLRSASRYCRHHPCDHPAVPRDGNTFT